MPNHTEKKDGIPSNTDYEPKYEYIDLCDIMEEYRYKEPWYCNLQSGEVDVVTSGITNATGSTRQEVLDFKDDESGTLVDIPATVDYVMSSQATDAELKDFLNRPVLIHTKTWTEATSLDPLTDNFRPWTLFFDQVAIQKKIDNFYLIQCNLHIKIMINASPFYYGCAMVAYEPLPVFNPSSVIIGSNNNYNVGYSQRPNVKLYPQSSEGGEIVCPFLYHKEWLDITSRQDLNNMGYMTMTSFTDLLNANSIAGQDCTIQIYAWAEDVRLSGPTLKLSLQSAEKDEYHHEGTISKPASAIARSTGLLSNIPVIGPFMTATSLAADAVAGIAALFGYTNVPVIDDVHAFKNSPLPHLATCDIGIPYEKLTVDSKNELSIDSKICGAALTDELNLSSFLKRESWFYTGTWASTDIAGDLLFNFLVSPQLKKKENTSGGTVLYQTPLGYTAECFRHWRGDIKVHLRVISSQYHRGRFKISWDPIYDIGSAPSTTTENYSTIVDITETSDITINIPYIQPTAYLETTMPVGDLGAQGTALANNPNFSNGLVTVSVVTNQTSPIASADIKILCFISGGDNFEFANPREIDTLHSAYAIQSKEINFNPSDTTTHEMGSVPSVTDDRINLVYMGEHITSLRQLFRRAAIHSYMPFDYTHSASDVTAITANIIARRPRYPGYDPDGPEAAIGLVSGLSESYNWVNWTYMTWFERCFVGARGSINWVINAHSNIELDSVYAARSDDTGLLGTGTYYTNAAVTASLSKEAQLMTNYYREAGQEGVSATNQKSMTTLHVVAPYYCRYKFGTNGPADRTLGFKDDDSDHQKLILGAVLHPSANEVKSGGFDLYVSAGVDYNLIFFLNVPSYYTFTASPVAV